MKLSASQAAKQTGKSIPTITRAIKSGKLSAEKQESGGFLIEASELFRVFPAVTANSNDTPDTLGIETPTNNNALEVEVKMLRERLTDRQSEIDHLRGLLDAEATERRKLTMMLTDERGRAAAPATADKPKRSWWPFSRQND